MKTYLQLLIISLCFLSAQRVEATISTCIDPACNPPETTFGLTGENSTFRRTYQHRSMVHRKQAIGIAQARSGNGPVITKSDFEDHFALDRVS